MTPPPSYPFPTAPMSGNTSRFPPTGQARQIIPQPTQQYYTMMSPPSYPLMTTSMPSTGQARQTIRQPTDQYYTTTSVSPSPAVNMVSHSTPQSPTITPDYQIVVSGRPDHRYQDTMPSLKSRYPSQTNLPGLSTSVNHRERSFIPPGRTHIANSSNVNTATPSFGFAAGPSSRVANMSIDTADAAIHSSGTSNGSEAVSAPSFPTYKNHTQLNDVMIDNTARSQFPTAKSIPFNNFIPLMSNNASGPQTTYTHPPAINMNQYTGYVPFHNPPSLHSAQCPNTVAGNSLPPSSLLPMSYLPQYISRNADLAPTSSFAHNFGTQYGSQPAGPPAPSMAPSLSMYPRQDLPHRNSLSRPSSKHRRKTHTQKTQPSSSTTYSCDWLDEDNTLCGFKGLLSDLKKHFMSSHLSGAQDALGRCHWQDCQYRNRTDPTKDDMRRDCTWRHVRESHLKIKRRM
ncbi:hypothetical protein F4604DRAFT_422261 [Suillus subluteus]|nr:hypothetical protein F4604DRAFT_422261 [Suillus subluteus]